jgi:hypothetical protein
MALLVPDVGEVRLLTELLDGGTARENWTLKLYKTNVTPAETDTAASYTEADFTGYATKTLTRTVSGATWSTPATAAGVTSSTYGAAAQSWSATSAQTIYGYYVVGATSTILIYAELFGSSISLVNPSTLTLQPKIQLD